MWEINFFSDANMTTFWENVQALLSTISPGIMLVTATAGVGILLPIVIRSFKDKDKEKEEDYEMKHY